MFRSDRRAENRGRAGAIAVVAALLVAAAPGAAQHQHEGGRGDLGVVTLEVSCDAGVRGAFDRGLALLHHMMYEESRAAFRAAAEADPSCGMAHWGMAMTRVQPLWYPASDEALREGAASLARAREAGSLTAVEGALIRGSAPLFADVGEVDWWARLQGWADAMRSAWEAHPEELEVGALYGLAEIAAGQVAEDRLAYNGRAAAALLRVYEREPRHPGASHYTIHANDVAGRASESLEIVRGYDGIAPSVPHALHMPTHILVRLGEWPGVIEWNRKSADAALNFPVGDRVSMHYIHAIDYLVYAHLQRGEDERAEALRGEAWSRGAMEEQFATAFHLAVIPARLALERRAWEEAAAIEPRTPDYLAWDRYPWAEGIAWFGRGMGAARTGALEAAREAEARLAGLREAAETAGLTDHARYIEIDRLILDGWIARASGADEAALSRLVEAAALEQSVQKHPVTPGALLPPYEALGELLLDLGRPAEALAAFETSLEIWPARFNSVAGAARAAVAAGDAERARAHYRDLLAIAGEAGTDRPEVRAAARVVGGD